MKPLIILSPSAPSPSLAHMIQGFTRTWQGPCQFLSIQTPVPSLQKSSILFAIDVDNLGYTLEFDRLFLHAVQNRPDAFYQSVGAVLVASQSELYTKTAARSLVFKANCLGMSFMGRPLVEATASGRNFYILQKKSPLPWQELAYQESRALSQRLYDFQPISTAPTSILALHSCGSDTSNTYLLWSKVKSYLKKSLEIEEIDVGNGQVKDCKGCPYKVCKHYGAHSNCFYGGIMVSDVYPAIEKCQGLLFICPNYNDALSANLSAVINRLTALFRKTKFFDKNLYAIVVSGNSGSDALGEQLISALNMNKTFSLPPYFLLHEIANDRGDIEFVNNIDEKAKKYADTLMPRTL